MASRKQRRRRAKERRHEYEYVYVDEEGREVEVPPEEVAAVDGRGEMKASPAKGAGKAVGRTPAKAGASKAGRPAREVPPPSWNRVLKRSLIFAPFMFLTITLLGRNLTVGQRMMQTAYLLVLFVPFSYLVDRAMHRRYLRQIGQLPQSRKSS